MKLKEKLTEIENKLKIENLLPGYKVNKKIFQISIILLGLFSTYVILTTGTQNTSVYVDCQDNVCMNPLYVCNPASMIYDKPKICDLVNKSFYKDEYLIRGEHIGNKPTFLLKYSFNIAFMIMLSALILNHLLYNLKKDEVKE